MVLQLLMKFIKEESSTDDTDDDYDYDEQTTISSSRLLQSNTQYGTIVDQQQHQSFSSNIERIAKSVSFNCSNNKIIHESFSTIPQTSSPLPPPPPPPPASSSLLSMFTSFFSCPSKISQSIVIGSVPHSVMVATTIGVACGISAYIYNFILQYLLITVWKTWSQYIFVSIYQTNMNDGYDNIDTSLPKWTVVWIPIVAIVLSIGLGYTVRFVGEPGDLASTIQCVHRDGFVELNHALPMIIASLFSIVAAASVGPEAALVAVCATLAGYISQTIYGTDPKIHRNLVRKHTLMGVSTQQ
jgi:hypothetical protein